MWAQLKKRERSWEEICRKKGEGTGCLKSQGENWHWNSSLKNTYLKMFCGIELNWIIKDWDDINQDLKVAWHHFHWLFSRHVFLAVLHKYPQECWTSDFSSVRFGWFFITGSLYLTLQNTEVQSWWIWLSRTKLKQATISSAHTCSRERPRLLTSSPVDKEWSSP